MRPAGIERKLRWGIAAVVAVPGAVAEGVLAVLYARAAPEDARGFLLGALVVLPALMACAGWIAHGLAAPLVDAVRRLRHGAELIATVHPEHRIEVRTGDELEALAGDVNRLADRLRAAERGGDGAADEAARERHGARATLAAIVEGLAAGVVVAARDGRITLANAAARDLLGAGAPLVGHSLFGLLDGPHAARVEEALRAGVCRGGRATVATGDGSALPARLSPLLGEDGALAGVILALGDPGDAARAIAGDPGAPPPAGPAFAGAGLASGVAGDAPGPVRPELYDFSLIEDAARRAPPALRERRLDALTFVVLDVETTGLRPEAGDRIVSLAGVRVRDGAVKPGERFDALVCPGRPIPAESTRVHGITDAMVAGAPDIGAVLPAFLRFAEGAVIVGHEVSFDAAFLDRDLRRLRRPRLAAAAPLLDTRLMSRLVHGPGADHTLEAVAERLGVAVIGRHSALGDALVTAGILARLLALLRARGTTTLGALLDALGRGRP